MERAHGGIINNNTLIYFHDSFLAIPRIRSGSWDMVTLETLEHAEQREAPGVSRPNCAPRAHRRAGRKATVGDLSRPAVDAEGQLTGVVIHGNIDHVTIPRRWTDPSVGGCRAWIAYSHRVFDSVVRIGPDALRSVLQHPC
jgi:hypothetical protein